ncbi:MAG: sigma-70 family polymerase sigma factor, partial [Bacteroidetes bacterium]|nr:sigma-70 family polymerase sigma factor [Bacteroidota bacterium]
MKSGTIKKYQHLADAELVERYRSMPDPEVLGELYQRYMVLVYGVCMKYLKNREDSQDAVMQIYETLVREIPRFE